MSDVDKALATQLANITQRTGKTQDELRGLLDETGLTKHGQLRDHLKQNLGMGHGDANTVVTLYLAAKSSAVGSSTGQAVDEIYGGGKEHLRPIHDALMAGIEKFGEFEIAPKKGYLSLRRKKQFAMIGPPTKTRVEVGLNMKGIAGTERLQALPAGGMCQYKVHVTDAGQVDGELLSWLRAAYDAAG